MTDIKAHIDDYIAKAPEPAGSILTKIRKMAAQLIPHATETISYQMPAFRDGKIFFYYAAFKNHIGIYPPLNEDAGLIRQLKKYRGPKGNLKFPNNEDIPYDLIAQIIMALHKQYKA